MQNLQLALIDNDYRVQAKTGFQLETNEAEILKKFFSRMQETLITGDTAFMEILDAGSEPIVFEVSLK